MGTRLFTNFKSTLQIKNFFGLKLAPNIGPTEWLKLGQPWANFVCRANVGYQILSHLLNLPYLCWADITPMLAQHYFVCWATRAERLSDTFKSTSQWIGPQLGPKECLIILSINFEKYSIWIFIFDTLFTKPTTCCNVGANGPLFFGRI